MPTSPGSPEALAAIRRTLAPQRRHIGQCDDETRTDGAPPRQLDAYFAGYPSPTRRFDRAMGLGERRQHPQPATSPRRLTIAASTNAPVKCPVRPMMKPVRAGAQIPARLPSVFGPDRACRGRGPGESVRWHRPRGEEAPHSASKTNTPASTRGRDPSATQSMQPTAPPCAAAITDLVGEPRASPRARSRRSMARPQPSAHKALTT